MRSWNFLGGLPLACLWVAPHACSQETSALSKHFPTKENHSGSARSDSNAVLPGPRPLPNEISVTETIPASELAFVTITGEAAKKLFEHLLKGERTSNVQCDGRLETWIQGENLSCLREETVDMAPSYSCRFIVVSVPGKIEAPQERPCAETIAGVRN